MSKYKSVFTEAIIHLRPSWWARALYLMGIRYFVRRYWARLYTPIRFAKNKALPAETITFYRWLGIGDDE